nr:MULTISPECIES: glycosyltransferase [unclassified Fibrobacter]
MNMYKNINREKIQFDFLVYCKTAVSYENEILQMGGRIFYVGNPLSVRTFFSALNTIKSFFKEHASCYQAVHLHSPTTAFFSLRYALKYGMKNRIVHSHSTMMSPNRIKTVVNDFLISRIKKYANIYWACSTEAAIFLYGSEWLTSNKYTIINNAVNCDKFCFNDEKRNLVRSRLNCSNKIVFCHVSNYSPIKNVLFLVDVMAECINLNNNIICLLIGDGPTAPLALSKIEEYGLKENFKFIGKTNEVNDFLCASDCLLLPSLKEGLPVTVVEAQACGLPCFISDTITKEVHVCDVKYFSLKKNVWQNAISSFEPLNDDLRNVRSQAFSDSKFSIKTEIKKIESLYLEMV